MVDISGAIYLGARHSEVLLEKPRTSGKIRIVTHWKSNVLGIDIDQGVLWESVDGRKGLIQALGDHKGSHHRLPHLKLHGDDRVGNGGELIDGSARKLKRFGVYVYNNDAGPLRQVRGMYTMVQIPGHQPVIVQFDEVDGPACGVLEVVRTTTGFTIRRSMYIVRRYPAEKRTNQELIDRHWGYGLSWSPRTKPPRTK